MLLACASAPDRLFLLELFFDAALPGTALLAHEFASSSLVVVQPRPRELQVSFLATFYAGIRLDVSRAEATLRARQTDRFALVLLGMVQHIHVELVLLHLFSAGIAAPRVGLALALDALIRIGFEAFGCLFNTARAASVALYTTQCPILGFLSIMMPLTLAKLFWPQMFAAY